MCEEIPGAADLSINELKSIVYSGKTLTLVDWDGEKFKLEFDTHLAGLMATEDINSGDYLIVTVKDGEILRMY
jgi:hypothetical protein